MSKRENLNKLKVNSLKEIARDQGIEIKKKKKEDLIREILTSQVPLIDLTPVTKSKEVLAECISPASGENENLPPYNAVHYKIHDQSQIPTFSFSDIYNFMILRPKSTGGSVNNFKGLDRAVKHFEAGHVQEISVSEINATIIYISAKCQASMKKHQYQVYICLSRNGQSVTNIHHGYCQCPVGLGQSCSHIGSLLFALSHIKPQESCTSKPCKWVVPKGRSKKPTGPLETLRSKADKMDTETSTDIEDASFDPRHTTDRDFDINTTLLQLRNLKDIFPSTGMSHLWNIPDDAPVAEREIEVETYEDPLEMASKALILSNENLPIPISIDENLSAYVEERTKGQRKCSLWTELHKGRITSSLFGAVLHAGPNPRSLVDQIIHGSSLQRYQTLPRPVQWGVDHEEEAVRDYLTLQNAVSDVTVETAGLTIYPSHAFLGASSDGWICDKSMPLGSQRGVLEIKCPYSISNEIIVEKEVHELVGKEGFCLENTPEGPRLNRSHKYYAQIQGEMAIMGCPWGDFVVWTSAKDSNCFIERIDFDSEFCTRMMPKLVEFFVHHILPFYKCTEN